MTIRPSVAITSHHDADFIDLTYNRHQLAQNPIQHQRVIPTPRIVIIYMMNSEIQDSIDGVQMEASHFQRFQPMDFSLTPQQYLIIQHHLPKKYALIEHKNIKKGGVVTSAVKLGPEDTQNLSKVSGNVENTEEIQGRTKRNRIKRVDKFLEQQPQKMRKQAPVEIPVEDEFAQCNYILTQLKKHKSAFPFLQPVDPKRDGVLNYFEIIKDPMDLSTIQSNLTNGNYRTPIEFHAHINKIWSNSYTFNEKGSLVHKMTVDMERYYNTLLKSDGYKKGLKGDKQKARIQKQKQKIEAAEERDERKKAEYFSNKDYVYDGIND